MNGTGPRVVFWRAFAAGLATLVASVAVLLALAAASESAAAFFGGLLGVLAAAAWLANEWGGRVAVLGVVAGFLGTVAFLVLFVAACALIVGGPL